MGIEVTEMLIIVATLLLQVGAHDVTDTALLVNTTTGMLQGGVRDLNGTTLYNWVGVPYAEPPTGRNRFRRPISKTRWNGTRNATEQPSICFQSNRSTYSTLKHARGIWRVTGDMSEDCLYLNVLKPSSGRNTSYPTIVWIHGGTFQRGSVSATMYDPAYLVTKGDVIVVSIQYRLGPFGFLGLGNSLIPGNMGLLDQAVALKWVKDNIEAFGGDKDNITLMGESAGAALVGYHMISNMTRGLFEKAIIQSGGPFSYWAYMSPDELKLRSTLIIGRANCTSKNASLVYQCLMKIKPEDLIAADRFPLSLGPTTDYYFLYKSPMEAVRQKDFGSKPVLGGLVRSEGMPAIITLMKDVNFSEFSKENFTYFAALMTQYVGANITSMKALGKFYLKQYESFGDSMYSEAATQLFGDFAISCPAMDFLNNMTDRNSTLYLYYFNHRSQLERDPPYTGVMHGADVPFVFGRPFKVPKHFDDVDRNISEYVIKIWTSFAATGVPSGNWTSGGEHFLEISATNETEMKRREPFCSEWLKYANYATPISAKKFVAKLIRSLVTVTLTNATTATVTV